MFDFLPAANAVQLPRSPLAQVIAQVKFGAQSTLSTQQGVALLHDALSHRYPRLVSEQQAVITAAPTGVSSAQITQWRMADLEGQSAAVVSSEQISIETSAYTNWSDLREVLEEVLIALDDVAGPKVRERVGLRYVNHVPANAEGSFVDDVRAELRGLVDTDGWRQATSASLSQTLLQDGNTQLTLRYGTGPQVIQGALFVLDIDCSDAQPVIFERNATLAYFDTLNDAAYRCFCACMTPTFLAV